MSDTVKFHIGQIVYRLIDQDKPIQITAIIFRQWGHFYWGQTKEGDEKSFYECEFTTEKVFETN